MFAQWIGKAGGQRSTWATAAACGGFMWMWVHLSASVFSFGSVLWEGEARSPPSHPSLPPTCWLNQTYAGQKRDNADKVGRLRSLSQEEEVPWCAFTCARCLAGDAATTRCTAGDETAGALDHRAETYARLPASVGALSDRPSEAWEQKTSRNGEKEKKKKKKRSSCTSLIQITHIWFPKKRDLFEFCSHMSLNPNEFGHLATKVKERKQLWVILYIFPTFILPIPSNIRGVEWRVLRYKFYKCLVSFHGLPSFAIHYCKRLPGWVGISGPVFPTLIHLPNEYLKP